MSMDDQYREMQRFHQALVAFNQQMRTSIIDLDQQHETVSPLWQDEMRRTYDAQWVPLHDHMHAYLRKQAPDFESFLRDKLIWLGRYLHGN